MIAEMSRHEAQQVRTKLLNAPVAPDIYSYLINVGTEKILDALEKHYFKSDLANGISCFKYLEGHYGSGKTQFIHSLAKRASRNNIVVAVIDIGQECPFNSPLAIFRAIMSSFIPPAGSDNSIVLEKGIEILIHNWICQKLREMGAGEGQQVPEAVQRQIERQLNNLWIGAPDSQMASALAGLSSRILAIKSGANHSVTDQELLSWVHGDNNVRSRALKDSYGLHDPTRDDTAFKRLKTTIGFLRTRMSYRGFLVAFDEGTRTTSFRRGSVKRHQAIENMLTMINQNAWGEFAGVMFLYAATPDFRSGVIQTEYIALKDRIGNVSFTPGRPMTPLIELDPMNSDEMIMQIGERLMEVFSKAGDIIWNHELQMSNMVKIITAQKDVLVYLDKIPPRAFVYHYCMFLAQQENNQYAIDEDQARSFIQGNDLPDVENNE